MFRDWSENLRSGIKHHCGKHLNVTLVECCHCTIHHTSMLMRLSAIIPLSFSRTVGAFQDQLRDITRKKPLKKPRVIKASL